MKNRIIILLYTLLLTFLINFTIYADNNSVKGIIIARSGLTLRESPNLKSNKLLTIPYLTDIKIQKYSDTTDKIDDIESPWLQTNYNNSSGWVYGGYVLIEKKIKNPDIHYLNQIKFNKDCAKVFSVDEALKVAIIRPLPGFLRLIAISRASSTNSVFIEDDAE